MHHTNKKLGQTLVEAVVALASIMLTLGAITVAITVSVNNSTFLKDQSVAGKLAQEGMENVRYYRNSDPASFDVRSGIYCMGENDVINSSGGSCNPVVSPNDIIDNSFLREVQFTKNATECGNGTQVTVNVYWSSGKCPSNNRFCHTSRLESCFANLSGSGGNL